MLLIFCFLHLDHISYLLHLSLSLPLQCFTFVNEQKHLLDGTLKDCGPSLCCHPRFLPTSCSELGFETSAEQISGLFPGIPCVIFWRRRVRLTSEVSPHINHKWANGQFTLEERINCWSVDFTKKEYMGTMRHLEVYVQKGDTCRRV